MPARYARKVRKMEPRTIEPKWDVGRRFAFHFCCIYLVLYMLPFPLFQIPFTSSLAIQYGQLWRKIVPWVGAKFFKLNITIFPGGSGDTTFNYVQLLCYLIVALAGACIWTLLTRTRRNDAWVREWLRIYVRFYVASTMLTYGAIKVIQSQFPSPTLDRLLQPFGDASPMGLLWTFMGASPLYNLFTGMGEMIGGLLLTTRRTTLLGALVCFGVMSHVAALNFSYDVPVKLFSMHLVLMSLFLMIPDLRRLANVFLFNRPAEAAEYRPVFGRPWMHNATIAFRSLLVLFLVWQTLSSAQSSRKMFGDLAPRSPYYGVWYVDNFQKNGNEHAPLITDKERWRRIVFDNPMRVAVQKMDGSIIRFDVQTDPKTKEMTLKKRGDQVWKGTMTVRPDEKEGLIVEARIDGAGICAKLKKEEMSQFLLKSRGFNWINEYPFNR